MRLWVNINLRAALKLVKLRWKKIIVPGPKRLIITSTKTNTEIFSSSILSNRIWNFQKKTEKDDIESVLNQFQIHKDMPSFLSQKKVFIWISWKGHFEWYFFILELSNVFFHLLLWLVNNLDKQLHHQIHVDVKIFQDMD
jgi:hypothetical protein